MLIVHIALILRFNNNLFKLHHLPELRSGTLQAYDQGVLPLQLHVRRHSSL